MKCEYDGRRQFELGAIVPDVCIVDEMQNDRFAAIGEMRSPFRGVANWPWIDECFSAASTQFLVNYGEEKWHTVTGGVHDANGRPYLKMSSTLAADVVQDTADRSGGFLWMDKHHTGWAVKLGQNPTRDGSGRFAFCINWGGHPTLLDQDARERFSNRLESELDVDEISERDQARRQLEITARQLRLFNRAEQLLWAIHSAVLIQRQSVVLLPDRLLGNVIWGGEKKGWPRNWRRDLIEALRSLTYLRSEVLHLRGTGWQPQFGAHSVGVAHVERLAVTNPDQDYCRPSCPFYQSDQRHQHILVQVGYGFLGVLEAFMMEGDGQGNRKFDFNNPASENSSDRGGRARKRPIRTVNLVAKIFGPAKWARLSMVQQRIIDGLYGEITRSRKKQRPDNAEVTQGNQVPCPRGQSTIECPLLDPGCSYVTFGGNGTRKGRGYRVIGSDDRGWLHKFGYVIPDDPKQLAKRLREFLKELKGLSQIVGLVVAAIDPKTLKWFDHSALTSIAGQRSGWTDVDKFHFRFYAPEDYNSRLRRYFELQGRLAIPGDSEMNDNSTEVAEPSAKVRLQQMGITQREFADDLNLSRPRVTQLLNGKRRWPEELRQRADELLHAYEQQNRVVSSR